MSLLEMVLVFFFILICLIFDQVEEEAFYLFFVALCGVFLIVLDRDTLSLFGLWFNVWKSKGEFIFILDAASKINMQQDGGPI